MHATTAGSLARRAPSGAKPKSVLDQVGDFLQSRVDLATGKKPSPISRAMKNPNVPNLVKREVTKIKRATR